MQQVTLIGILGLAAIAACWSLAVVLYRVGSAGSTARKLALLLVVEGLCLATAGFPEFALGVPDSVYEQYPVLGIVSFISHHMADAAVFALYPPFLAAALQTKLTRPFAAKGARVSVAAAAVVLFFVTLGSAVFWDSLIGATFLYLALSLLFTYALVVSIHAWRIAAPGVARDRARAFTIAFGIRDVCWGFVYGASIWMAWTGTYTTMETNFEWLVKIVYALGTLLAVPLIAYGILRAQLFDIDLRIRWTIKQSTLATVVVTIIFLLSEGADRFLSAELGDFAGLLAAAVVVFFLTPLQRFAESIASAAMPNTQNTPEYVAHRKMQVYEAALADARQQGGISDKERALLNHLRESLGLSPADADALEREQQPDAPS